MTKLFGLSARCSVAVAVLAATLHCGAFAVAQEALSTSDEFNMRAQSYGGRGNGPLDACKEGCRSVVNDHWWVAMPSLPGQRSNLIVKGTTSTCEANISSDRTATFTTCGVEIEKVIKNSTTANLSQDSKVIVTREGGNAEIGGLKVASSVAGQALPQPATTYIFFLRYRPAAHDYMILTFYRVTSQGMQALDEPPFFHIHDGKRVGAFLADVDSSMSDESQYLRHHIAEEAK